MQYDTLYAITYTVITDLETTLNDLGALRTKL